MNKSTKRRLITSIICFTACASLVGVGFSLWTAGNGSASASGEGDLVTDDFFAKINIENISVDPFCPSGFLKGYNEEFQGGYEIAYEGHVKGIFSLDFTSSRLENNSTISVTAELGNYWKENNYISFNYNNNVSSWTYGYGKDLNFSYNKTGYSISQDDPELIVNSVTAQFEDILIDSTIQKLYFGIDLLISSDAANFTEKIYGKLSPALFYLNVSYEVK